MSLRPPPRWLVSLVAAALATLTALTVLGAEDADAGPIEDPFPVLMRTKDITAVHHQPHKFSVVLAKVFPRAVLKLARRFGGGGCPAGWLERSGGGFVCSKHLGETDETEPRPAARDLPDALDGTYGVEVVRSGPRLYRSLGDIDRRRPEIVMWEGTILRVRRSFTRYGTEYHETRQGWYAEARHGQRLGEPILSLGVEVTTDQPAPGGIVVEDGAAVWAQPGIGGEPLEHLERYSTVAANGTGPLAAEDGWVAIGERRYLSEDDLALVRPAPRPKQLDADERWIAVDLREQLLHAYEGERLVRVVPCSTGKGGNTKRGTYRIQWKRRMQTMRLKLGHMRVEDVQWVMYYDRKSSIAIHSAYWHRRFGRPASHGCVNLPRDDARWVFEWSVPHVQPEDSERFPTRKNPGSRVVVF